jgi:hypothetical protein
VPRARRGSCQRQMCFPDLATRGAPRRVAHLRAGGLREASFRSLRCVCAAVPAPSSITASWVLRPGCSKSESRGHAFSMMASAPFFYDL